MKTITGLLICTIGTHTESYLLMLACVCLGLVLIFKNK